MNIVNRSNVRHLALCLLAAGVGSASLPAASAVITFPPDSACHFGLQVDTSGGNTHYREFVDKDGNVVRTLAAGKGPDLVFTNVTTGATFSLKGNGSDTHTAINQDGSSTVVLTGHNILILFPTDTPAGPSTTLYVGRVVFTSDPFANFTLQSVSGNSTDICAALS